MREDKVIDSGSDVETEPVDRCETRNQSIERLPTSEEGIAEDVCEISKLIEMFEAKHI